MLNTENEDSSRTKIAILALLSKVSSILKIAWYLLEKKLNMWCGFSV